MITSSIGSICAVKHLLFRNGFFLPWLSPPFDSFPKHYWSHYIETPFKVEVLISSIVKYQLGVGGKNQNSLGGGGGWGESKMEKKTPR